LKSSINSNNFNKEKINTFANPRVITYLLKDFKKTNNLSIAVIGIPRSETTSIAAGL
tara:strand:+ start:98 stop:268 length:171 start_codon:yes stop_codon:yes gene_type:complete